MIKLMYIYIDKGDKRMFKKVLSTILALAMLPCVASYTASASAKNEYDASIFGNNAEYLLEEHFAEVMTFKMDEESDQYYRRPSGWDVDYRGGRIYTEGYVQKLDDTSTTEEISLKREILPVKSGEVTFETKLKFNTAQNAGFSVILGDGENQLLNLYFNAQKISSISGTSKTALCDLKAWEPVHIKAKISMDTKTINLHTEQFAEGVLRSYDGTIPFAGNVSEFSTIELHTGKEAATPALLYFVNVYKNFLVNEKFMTTPLGKVPKDFTLSSNASGSGVADAPGSKYRDDENGFLLKNDNQTPEVSLTTNFNNNNDKTSVSFTMLMPKEVQNGFYTRLATASKPVATLYTTGGKLYANGQLAESALSKNLWYTFSVDIDKNAGTYDLMLNKRTVLEDIPLYNNEIPTRLSFSKAADGTKGEILLDDIEVTPTFEKYADYPTAPSAVSSDNVATGMVMYPMWREGMHYGWDSISPYQDERKPYMGYYTEGQREVSDWQNKWMAEHGIDYALYPFVRPIDYDNKNGKAEPVKEPTRSEDLMDGYMNSYYKDNVKFAIYLSSLGTDKYTSADEFIENVLPYIKEYYFKNPNYMKINNKLPIACYQFSSLKDCIGGTAGVQKVLDALDSAAKDLGYDGIIFGADASSGTARTAVKDTNRSYIRIWNYTQYIDSVGALTAQINNQYTNSEHYIPSISVGIDDTPWRESPCRMLDASEVKEVCNYVKNHSKFKAEAEKMVLFTCWNEYGEGHFFAPSTKEGFGYLNAIRDVFTEGGEKKDEVRPSELSVARMEALYPNGRGALKMLKDRPFSGADLANRKVLFKYDFTSASSGQWTRNNCNLTYKSDELIGTATNTNPWIQRQFDDTGVPISEVRAIRVRMYEKGATNLSVYYHTTDWDKDNTIADQWAAFYQCMSVSGDEQYTDYILRPNSGAEGMTGNVSMLRLRLDDALYSSGGKKFGVKSIELLGDVKTAGADAKYEFGQPSSTSGCTANVVDGAVLATATANDPQLYYNNIASMGIDMSKVKAVKIRAFTENTSDLTVFYQTDGNVSYYHSPYKFVTNKIAGDGEYAEYTLTQDNLGSNPAPTGNIKSFRIDPADNIYESGGKFGIDWIEFYYQTEYDSSYKLVLKVDGEAVEPLVPIEEKDGEAYIPIYKILLKDMGAYVVWNEREQTLAVEKGTRKVKMTMGSKSATVNGNTKKWANAPYYSKGDVFVPAQDFFNAMGYAVDYQSSQRTLSCTPSGVSDQTFAVAVTPVGDNNIAPGFWDGSATANDYFINGTSVNGLNLSTITEVVGGENVLKITPPGGAGSDALFVCRGVNLGGSSKTLKDFFALGTKMKVSFSYKGVGTGIKVENREAGGGNTESKSAAISQSEWKTFEYTFDNSKFPVTDQARWLAVRLSTSSGTTPYMYLKDFKISFLGTNVTIQAPVDERVSTPYNCYVAEYDDDNRLIKFTNIKSGNTSEKGDYQVMIPFEVENECLVKAFIWNGITPLCNVAESE